MIKWTSILTATTSIIREHSNHPWIVMDFCCVKSKSQWVSWHPILPRKVRFSGYLWSSKTPIWPSNHTGRRSRQKPVNRHFIKASKNSPKHHPFRLSLLKPSGRSKHVEKSWLLTSGSTALVIAKCWNVETAKRGVLERLPLAKSTA